MSMRNLFSILTFLPNIRRHIGVLIAVNVVSAIISTSQPYAFKLIIDSITSSVSTERAHTAASSSILMALGLLLALRLINAGFNYFTQIASTRIFQNILGGLRTAIFERITLLSVEYFEKERIGAISQRYSGSTSDVGRWTYTTLGMLLPQLLSVILILGILFFTDVWVGALTVVAITLFFATQVPTLRRVRPLLKEANKELETASAYFNETVSHIATVRAFGGESSALEMQNQALERRFKLIMSRERILQANVAFRQVLYTLMIVLGIGQIARGVLTGAHTPGDVLLVALYLQQIQSSLWPIGRMIIDTTEADASAERIVSMLETQPTVKDNNDAVELKNITSIEFKRVSFAYPGNKAHAISNISFKIEQDQTTAFVGPSGTGKSTITKLLLRFYEPTSGEILVNGWPIESFTQSSIRQHIGVVMQDVALFNDTIEANLQLANPKAKKTALRTAAQEAHADIFIDALPDGYKTVVGERGVKLSGGEKQRVAIARAILKKPDFIILDEATSALDSQSEQYVQEGLSKLMEGRTGLVIAHRLSTIMNADQIIVMREGKVVERGTHAELSGRKRGLYAKLFHLQTKGFIAA